MAKIHRRAAAKARTSSNAGHKQYGTSKAMKKSHSKSTLKSLGYGRKKKK